MVKFHRLQKKRGVFLALLALLLCILILRHSTAAADGAPEPTPLSFQLATAIVPTSKIQLVNGVAVDVKARLWPTVVITPIQVDGNTTPPEGRCTGTLVGQEVILLAAHCLDLHGLTAKLRPAFLQVDSERVQLQCAVLPKYLDPVGALRIGPRRSEDIALCHAPLQKPHPVLANMEYETIDTAPLGRRAAVLMSGYGCTDLKHTADMDTTLRIGDAVIARAAPGAGAEPNFAWILSDSTQPTLCPGDSGGPLFTGATTQYQDLPRRVRGVNSSVEGDRMLGYTSRVAMLSQSDFPSWADGWLKTYSNAYICGISNPVPGHVGCENLVHRRRLRRNQQGALLC